MTFSMGATTCRSLIALERSCLAVLDLADPGLLPRALGGFTPGVLQDGRFTTDSQLIDMKRAVSCAWLTLVERLCEPIGTMLVLLVRAGQMQGRHDVQDEFDCCGCCDFCLGLFRPGRAARSHHTARKRPPCLFGLAR